MNLLSVLFINQLFRISQSIGQLCDVVVQSGAGDISSYLLCRLLLLLLLVTVVVGSFVESVPRVHLTLECRIEQNVS